MKRIMLIGMTLIILASACMASAKSLHPEKWYQEKWCDAKGGKTEVVFEDRTRCDCLTNSHAIEFDFGKKWAESIGQALHYSIETGKRAGVVLILEKSGDYKYWSRLNTIIDHFGLPIDAWITTPPGCEFDFGSKWAESIGQALYYSIQTGKKAGIVLILEKPGDKKYWDRLNTIIKHFGLPIDTWKTAPAGGVD